MSVDRICAFSHQSTVKRAVLFWRTPWTAVSQDPGAEKSVRNKELCSLPVRLVPSPQIAPTDTRRLWNRRYSSNRLESKLSGYLLVFAPSSQMRGGKTKLNSQYLIIISVREVG